MIDIEQDFMLTYFAEEILNCLELQLEEEYYSGVHG